jgi:hypothetical protein
MSVRLGFLSVGMAMAIGCNAAPVERLPPAQIDCPFDAAECDRMVREALGVLGTVPPPDQVVAPILAIVVGDECPPNARCVPPVSRIVAVLDANRRVHGVRVYLPGLGDPDFLAEVPRHIVVQLEGAVR